MHATTVPVDVAKSVFQIAVADEHWRVFETQRLTRSQFERWFLNREIGLVVMEARGSAHHWARWLGALGFDRESGCGDRKREWIATRLEDSNGCRQGVRIEFSWPTFHRVHSVDSCEQRLPKHIKLLIQGQVLDLGPLDLANRN